VYYQQFPFCGHPFSLSSLSSLSSYSYTVRELLFPRCPPPRFQVNGLCQTLPFSFHCHPILLPSAPNQLYSPLALSLTTQALLIVIFCNINQTHSSHRLHFIAFISRFLEQFAQLHQSPSIVLRNHAVIHSPLHSSAKSSVSVRLS